MDTASITKGRTYHTLALSVAVQNGCNTFSWDMRNDLLRGPSFAGFSVQGGVKADAVNEAWLGPPADVITILQDFPKTKGCNMLSHVLKIVNNKGASGLMNAPLLVDDIGSYARPATRREAAVIGLLHVDDVFRK